jgi:hypothetical protein
MLHTFIILERAGGGLPRAFAIPIILMTIDGIDRNSEKQSAIGAILGFAIYPTAGLIALTTHCIWLIKKNLISKSNKVAFRKFLLKLGIIILLCLISVAPSLFSNRKFGKTLSLHQARLMPEVGANGRYQLIPLPKITNEIGEILKISTKTSGDSFLHTLERFTSESDGMPFYLIISFTLLLVLIGITYPPWISLYLGITGIILFSMASLFAFHLFLPERMVLYSFPAVILYLLSSTYTRIESLHSPRGIIPRFSSLAITIIFMVFFGIAFKGPIGLTVNAHPEKELFQLLQTLPKDALFSGHPVRINNVPLWAKRRILVSYETSQIFYDKAWKEIKERTYDNFDAYYASDTEPLQILRKKYRVDYMLVHVADISPAYAKHCKYFDPFNERLKRLCQKPSEELIWRKAAPQSIVGMASGYAVIDLDAFLKQLTSS